MDFGVSLAEKCCLVHHGAMWGKWCPCTELLPRTTSTNEIRGDGGIPPGASSSFCVLDHVLLVAHDSSHAFSNEPLVMEWITCPHPYIFPLTLG